MQIRVHCTPNGDIYKMLKPSFSENTLMRMKAKLSWAVFHRELYEHAKWPCFNDMIDEWYLTLICR